MKLFFVFAALFSSFSLLSNAEETWQLELKEGTIFTLKKAPVRDGEVYKFEVGGKQVEAQEKSVASLTSGEPLLERFIYSEYEGKKISAADAAKTVVRVVSELHRGSGTIIHPDGYILTNNHLVSNNHELEVTLHDGKKYKVTIVAKSSLFDLAVLKIETDKKEKKEDKQFAYAKFGDERKLKKDAKTYTFSTSAQRPWKKVEAGLINRSEYFGKEDGIIYQQYRIKMRPDDTGSPVFDENGSLVGIVTQKTKSIHSKEIWFSTPASFVKTVMKNVNAYIHNPSDSPIRYNNIEKK